MKIQVPINGISTSPVYKDGDTISLVNLRNKAGALEPIPPRKITKTLSDTYDLVFVHQLPSTGENWIGVKGNDIYHDGVGLIGTVINIKSIQQVGNILVFITESDLYYAIYKDTNYLFLGSLPDVPQINVRAYASSSKSQTFTTTKTNFEEDVKAALNVALNDSYSEYGRALIDAHFLIMAFRLYDGTYIKHSSPFLILPPHAILSGLSISYQLTSGSQNVTSGTAYARTYGIFFHKNGDSVVFDGSLPEYENWKGVIESLDFFLSPSLGVSNVEMLDKEEHDLADKTEFISSNAIKTYRDSAREGIRDVSNFHLIRSIPIDQTGFTPKFDPDRFPSTGKKDDDILLNLINQEELTENLTSRSTWGALKSYIYNSRLHLADIQNKLFNGYLPKKVGVYSGLVGLDDYPYNGNTIPWFSDYPDYIATRVDIQLKDGLVSVWSYSTMHAGSGAVWLGSPYFNYPDSRAVKIAFYVFIHGDSTWNLMYEAPLKKHPFLNSAFYLNPTFSPVEDISDLEPDSAQPEMERDVFEIDRNKLKVSQVNNPFTFQDENTYLIGTGTIRNLSSNAMRISEGQFGQFPLYILTTENIYALNVGQEVLYTTQSPVSNESPTSDVICQTPFGVIFIGKRGLYVINGQQVELLTPFLETSPDDVQLSLPSVEKCPKIGNLKTWNDNFIDYLKDVKEIVYDSKESEIILLNTGKDYNFVYNIPSKMWYQQTEDVNSFVKNVFPELFGVHTTSVKDFSQPKTTTVGEVTTIDKALISLITRPINFGSLEYKRIEQLILRLRLKGKDIIFLTNTSRDDINFDLDKGFILADGNYKDINLGRFIKKYRNVIIMLTAEVESDTKIYLLDANVEPGYNKMM
jgi:hypothetical protein